MDFKELKLDKLGFKPFDKIYRNLPIEKIIEEGLINGETVMGMNGAPIVDTGDYTGRSPNDKYFVVEPSSEDKIWWGPVNAKIDSKIFDKTSLPRCSFKKIKAFFFITYIAQYILKNQKN